MARRQVKLGDQIRQAVKLSGLTNYRISKELGISEAMLCRFMLGHCGMSLEKLDRLAALLDLIVTSGPNAAKPADFPDQRFKKPQTRRTRNKGN